MLSPAWDPSSQLSPPSTSDSWSWMLPSTESTDIPSRPKHWLEDPKMQDSRLKLNTSDPSVQSPYVEFLGVENGLVKVRDKMDVRFLTFEVVHPLLPAAKGDLVIPKSGAMQGVHFIVQVVGDICVVRKPGTRPTKKNPDIEFSVSDLVQVHPTIRRR